MIVLDASVVVELLLGAPAAGAIEARIADDPSLHAPAVLDLEVAQAIRRYCATGQLHPERGRLAVGDLGDLPARRYPHTPLLERIWQLRPALTAYDAAYVVLAEVLGAPLLTRDVRLSRATGHAAKVEVI